ncbi:hypothetical protein BVY04_01955 [bacterium M21]|nr:hypothetical protein BVY04_01955 [bacterium M21]
MKLGCMLINFNNGTGSRAWDCSKPPHTETPSPSDFLSRCLDTYFSTISTDCPLVVVDDGSTDDSIEILERYSDGITHFAKNTENIGLTPSMEIAAELLFREGCDVVCRFDGDIEFLTQGWDLRVLQYFLMNRRAGAVGAVQVTPCGGIWAHGDMIVHPDGHTHLFGPKSRTPENCQLSYGDGTHLGNVQCDSVMGSLAAFRTTAYKRVNGLRQEFNQLRGETEDLNLRLLLENFTCTSLGGVYVMHRASERADRCAVRDTDTNLDQSFTVWNNLWGFDKRNVNLTDVYEKWQGTPLARHLTISPSSEVLYLGP